MTIDELIVAYNNGNIQLATLKQKLADMNQSHLAHQRRNDYLYMIRHSPINEFGDPPEKAMVREISLTNTRNLLMRIKNKVSPEWWSIAIDRYILNKPIRTIAAERKVSPSVICKKLNKLTIAAKTITSRKRYEDCL